MFNFKFMTPLLQQIKSLVHPSGGLLYHFKAFVFAQSWRPFQIQVAGWLEGSHLQKNSELLLIGPSGGYTLSSVFLKSFKRVFVIEPDPIARVILKSRNPAVSFTFLDEYQLFKFDSKGRFTELERILSEHTEASILFSNVLGQLIWIAPELVTSNRFRDLQENFKRALVGRNWASYHDLFSSQNVLWSKTATLDFLESARPVDGTSIPQITDHDTQGWANGLETQAAIWKLSPRQTHVVGFVQNSAKLVEI